MVGGGQVLITAARPKRSDPKRGGEVLLNVLRCQMTY